jgi:hypothetical protein
MKQQINEIERMQQLAGILNEATPTLPPVPGQKPKMPPVPGKSSSAPLDDKRKEKAADAFFQASAQLTTLKNSKLISDSEIKTLENLLSKAIEAVNSK